MAGAEIGDEQHVDDRIVADALVGEQRIENEELAEDDAGKAEADQDGRPPYDRSACGDDR